MLNFLQLNVWLELGTEVVEGLTWKSYYLWRKPALTPNFMFIAVRAMELRVFKNINLDKLKKPISHFKLCLHSLFLSVLYCDVTNSWNEMRLFLGIKQENIVYTQYYVLYDTYHQWYLYICSDIYQMVPICALPRKTTSFHWYYSCEFQFNKIVANSCTCSPPWCN